MRTVAATRQGPADLTSKPQALTWLVYCRENKLLTASEWALAAILVTLGKGQNITLSVTGMADILHMRRDTVSKAINGLIAKGLMVEKGKGRSNKTFYRLTLPKATDGMRTSHCPNEDQSLTESGPVDCPNEDHNIEEEDEENDKKTNINMRSARDDDVGTKSTTNRAKGTAQPSSTRAKGPSSAQDSARADKVSGRQGVPPDDQGVPAVRPVEEYIADLEGCVDELADRLGVEPGSVNIKELAKWWRKVMVQQDDDGMFSDLLDVWPADYPEWSMAAEKDNPVGFFRFIVEQFLQGNDIAARAPRVVRAADRDLAARIVVHLAINGSSREDHFYEAVGSEYHAIQPVLDALVESGRIIRSENPDGAYYLYKEA